MIYLKKIADYLSAGRIRKDSNIIAKQSLFIWPIVK
jgi:hypothetical protein